MCSKPLASRPRHTGQSHRNRGLHRFRLRRRRLQSHVIHRVSGFLNRRLGHQRRRFEGVKTLHLSIYHIISIEEVGLAHKGLKFKKDKSHLVVLTTDQPPPKG